jgi:hypothetical protein
VICRHVRHHGLACAQKSLICRRLLPGFTCRGAQRGVSGRRPLYACSLVSGLSVAIKLVGDGVSTPGNASDRLSQAKRALKRNSLVCESGRARVDAAVRVSIGISLIQIVV